MLCFDLLDYPSDGWLTELTLLAKPSSLALLLDYPKARSALQQRFAIASQTGTGDNQERDASLRPPIASLQPPIASQTGTGDRTRASSLENALQAFDRGHPTNYPFPWLEWVALVGIRKHFNVPSLSGFWGAIAFPRPERALLPR